METQNYFVYFDDNEGIKMSILFIIRNYNGMEDDFSISSLQIFFYFISIPYQDSSIPYQKSSVFHSIYFIDTKCDIVCIRYWIQMKEKGISIMT